VEHAILDVKRRGHKGVVLAPIGFLCDHVEVLYDVDIVFKAFALENGLQFWRTESLNTSPALVSALAKLATGHLSVASGQQA
jgi:ferrochelatase